jgi:outer membrane protein OmpA-like peptidoglycan-associated protein
MKKVILALTIAFSIQAQAQQKTDALIEEYITDRISLQVSVGNNFDLYQPLNDANLVLIPLRDFRSFYSGYDVFAWNLEGQAAVALNPVWSLYVGGSFGTMSGSNNTDYYRASMLNGDIGLKFNISNMRIKRKRSKLKFIPLAGLSYNYFESELFYLSDVTPQHSEKGFAPGLNVGAELDFSLTKNLSVFGSMVRRGFKHDGLDGWDYGGNGDNYLRTNVGVKIKLTKTKESEHASDINIWDLVSNNSKNVTNIAAPQEKDILEFKYRMNNYVVGDKSDYEKGRKLNPTLYVVRGLTYNIKNTAEDHPLRLSKKPKRRKQPAGLSKNGIRPDHGIVSWKIPMDAPEEYYYFSDQTDSIGGVIKVLSPAEASKMNKKVVNNEGDTTINNAQPSSPLEPQEDFAFDVGKDHVRVGDPNEYEDGNNEDPVIYVVRGGTYRLKNDSDKNPLRIGKSPGDKTNPKGLEKNGITGDDGTVEWKVPLDAPGEYYYYSGDDDEVGSVIKVLGPGEPQQADNGDLYATINHILFELDKLRQREDQVFDFDVTDDHVTVGDESDYEDGNNEEPIIYVVRGQTYNMKNKANDKPLRFSKSPDSQEDPKGLEDNSITEEDGTVEWSIPLDAPEEYYYYSEGDDEVGGVIKVLGPGEAPESANDEILDDIEDLKEEVERLKAMALQAPGDTSVTITTVQSAEPSHVYEFDVTDDHVTVGDRDDYENSDNKEPIIYVVRGESYTMKNNSEDKPLRFSKSPEKQENPKGLEENGITEEDGTVEWVIPLDAPEEYYYYSEEDDDKVGGIIKVLGSNDDWKDYIDDEISKLQVQFAEGSRDTAVSITNVQMVAQTGDDFVFEDQDSTYTIGQVGEYEEGINENPTIYVMRGQTYSFRNDSKDHPLRLSRQEAQRDDPRGLEKNAITKEDESVLWKIPHDAPDEYYYYSEANDTLRGIIKVVGQGGGDTYDVDMSQDFNKIVNDLQTRMEEELTNMKSADDIERFEGGQHLVLFYDVDIHILTRAQKKKIFEFVYKLNKESEGFEFKMIISGFADERASAAYNDALRQRRSNEVKKFFKQLGLDVPTEDRTAPHTYTGEMFLDRRVELTVEVTRTTGE